MVYHYRGGTDLVVSTRQTGVPKGAGTAGYLWDAEAGGNRYGGDAVFDDNGATGGQVQTNDAGRLSFTMDETLGASSCWLDLGFNERWLLRSWEWAGPPGPEGPPGAPTPSGGATGDLITYTAAGPAWADPAALSLLTATTGVQVASGRAPRLWLQATEPTITDGAVDGDWWMKP